MPRKVCSIWQYKWKYNGMHMVSLKASKVLLKSNFTLQAISLELYLYYIYYCRQYNKGKHVMVTRKKASKIWKIHRRIKMLTDVAFHKNQNYLALSSRKPWLYWFWSQAYDGKDRLWDKLCFVFLFQEKKIA